jgi:flagellar hook-associated protein FlgK
MNMKRRQINALVIACLSIALAGAVAGCRSAGSSPTGTMKAFFEATRKKDADGFKKTLSKGTLDMMETVAKAQNKSLDDMLKSGMNAPETAQNNATPEMRNEKINGDTATLEVQNDKSKQWETIPFVKENGEWKIALDKAMQDMGAKPPSASDVK